MNPDSRSSYDSAAREFEDHRGLPAGVPEAVRAAVWRSVGAAKGRVLDLGAGTGRFGRAFVAATDFYVGVDSSIAMLEEFAALGRALGPAPARLVQADGAVLPFRDATFDIILLIQVLSEGGGWRELLADARRVLRAGGACVVGRTLKPPDGVDTRLKSQLSAILEDMGAESQRPRGHRVNALTWLEEQAAERRSVIATSWTSERSVRRYVDRHQTGHRFTQLPGPVRDQAMRRLREWGTATFGSLDAVFPETYEFELQTFRFRSKGAQ